MQSYYKRIATLSITLLVCILSPGICLPSEKRLTVAAASVLSFALKEISQEFEKETSVRVILSFGSTGMLSMQIENGAPFDIFFAANERYIEGLREKGLIIDSTRQLYAQGRLVLAVNNKSGVKAQKLEDLLDETVTKIAIANPDHAPYGIAAKEAFIKTMLWDMLKPKLVYGENIRQALQFIQTGNATAGIVALSVADVPGVSYVLIDSNLHNPINQTVAVIKTTKVEREARLFIDYAIRSQTGKAIMKRYGFILPADTAGGKEEVF